VAVELEQVVGGGDQAPFGEDRAAAAALNLSRPRLNVICANTGSIIGWRFR
jgi:hypothetical protein